MHSKMGKNSTRQLLLPAFLLATLVYTGYCYPSGAPTLACQQMKPFHPPTTTTGTPPFALNLTQQAYKPGSLIQGTLYSPSGVIFRGFLIEVRSATNNASTTAVGEFVDLTNTSQTVCGNRNVQALTHTSNHDKSEATFTWRAPDDTQGDLIFRATVVESYNVSRYWMGIASVVARDCSLHPEDGDCNDITGAPEVSTQTTEPGGNTGTTNNVVTTQPTTSGPSGQITYDSDCGVKKGCFPECSSGCDYLVTWQADNSNSNGEDTVTFDIKMKLSNMQNVWTAIGFSPDGKMDKTNVAACVSGDSKMTIQSSVNNGYSNSMFADNTLGLNLMEGQASNGVFHCMFTREKRMNESGFYDLSKDYYLLVGTGPVNQGVIQQHLSIPYKSNKPMNFSAHGVASENNSASVLIKVHASLMAIAWVFLSSIGLVAARHCKSMLGLKLLFKLKAWFVVHRTAMVLVFGCVIASIVAIFYEKGGFKEISAQPGKEFTKAHPYMGLVVSALTVLNPFMALFRPSPESKRRYIFNWAHFSVGTSAHLTAIVTIFFGLNLDSAKINNNVALYVMIGYAVIFVLVQTSLEFFNRRHVPSLKYGTVSANNPHTSHSYMERRGNLLAYTLLIHGIVMFALAAVLVIIIWDPTLF